MLRSFPEQVGKAFLTSIHISIKRNARIPR